MIPRFSSGSTQWMPGAEKPQAAFTVPLGPSRARSNPKERSTVPKATPRGVLRDFRGTRRLIDFQFPSEPTLRSPTLSAPTFRPKSESLQSYFPLGSNPRGKIFTHSNSRPLRMKVGGNGTKEVRRNRRPKHRRPPKMSRNRSFRNGCTPSREYHFLAIEA